jgi:hypothetical protein
LACNGPRETTVCSFLHLRNATPLAHIWSLSQHPRSRKSPATASPSRIIQSAGASRSRPVGRAMTLKSPAGCGQFATIRNSDSASIFFSYVETLRLRPRRNAGPFSMGLPCRPERSAVACLDDDENQHAPRVVPHGYDPDDRYGSGYPRPSQTVELSREAQSSKISPFPDVEPEYSRWPTNSVQHHGFWPPRLAASHCPP